MSVASLAGARVLFRRTFPGVGAACTATACFLLFCAANRKKYKNQDKEAGKNITRTEEKHGHQFFHGEHLLSSLSSKLNLSKKSN